MKTSKWSFHYTKTGTEGIAFLRHPLDQTFSINPAGFNIHFRAVISPVLPDELQ